MAWWEMAGAVGAVTAMVTTITLNSLDFVTKRSRDQQSAQDRVIATLMVRLDKADAAIEQMRAQYILSVSLVAGLRARISELEFVMRTAGLAIPPVAQELTPV